MLSFFLFSKIVNLKRSKSAPGLIEASCRMSYHAPVRRTGSGIQRLSSIVEPVHVPIDHSQIYSSNSMLTGAPLASSVSVASSSNSDSIEHLKKCLHDLQQENYRTDPVLKQRYLDIESRLKKLQDKSS